MICSNDATGQTSVAENKAKAKMSGFFVQDEGAN